MRLQGLLLFPAVVIVPMLEILWVLFIMVSGGIYFGDFEKFSQLQLAMFGVGVFVLLLGIFCLIPSEQASGAPLKTSPLPCTTAFLAILAKPASLRLQQTFAQNMPVPVVASC